MSGDQFNKLFEYMEGEFQKAREVSTLRFGQMNARLDYIDTRFDKMDKRFDQVIAALDSMAKQQQTDDLERKAMGHQLSRIDNWVDRTAEQLNIRYDRAS